MSCRLPQRRRRCQRPVRREGFGGDGLLPLHNLLHPLDDAGEAFDEEVIQFLPQRVGAREAETAADMEQDGFDGAFAEPGRDVLGAWKSGWDAALRWGCGAGGASLARRQCTGGGARRVQTGGLSAEPFFQFGGKPQASGDAGEHQRDAFGAEADRDGEEGVTGGTLLHGGGDFVAEINQFADEAEQARSVGGRDGCPVLVGIGGLAGSARLAAAVTG